jgi:hypothetical protein
MTPRQSSVFVQRWPTNPASMSTPVTKRPSVALPNFFAIVGGVDGQRWGVSVHGSSVYCTVPSAQYKPQHTSVAQWYQYQYYCDITLAHFLLPVTVIRRLPFTLFFLTSFLLAFFQPKLTTSVLGLMHLTLPMM